MKKKDEYPVPPLTGEVSSHVLGMRPPSELDLARLRVQTCRAVVRAIEAELFHASKAHEVPMVKARRARSDWAKPINGRLKNAEADHRKALEEYERILGVRK